MLTDATISILMTLLAKRKVTREYLAERFSVSKRTITRYLTVLEDAGVPVRSSPGKSGGIWLADDFTVDRLFLSEAELMRVREALELTESAFGDRVNAGIADKLEALERSRERDNYAIDQDDLYIDCDYEQAERIRPRIRTLSEAIKQCRAVELKYVDSHGDVSFRTIEPYTLVFKEGAWYVYAMCKLRGDFRLFKLTRISDIRLTSKSFTRLESRLVEKLGLEYYNELYVDLEFEFFPTPGVTESIIDWLGSAAVTERGTKLVAQAEVPLSDALYKRLLSYGSSIKVLAPPEIAHRLRDDAKLMLDKYDDMLG